MAKRQITAQERVHLSQIAKQRKRGLKGTHLGGRFSAAASMAGKMNDGTLKKGVKIGVTPVNPSRRAEYQDIKSNVKSGRYSDEDIAYHVTRSQAMGRQGPQVRSSDMRSDAPVRVKSSDVRDVQKLRRDVGWRKEKGLYANDQAKKGKHMAPGEFVQRELPPSHKDWLDKQLKDPKSEFNKNLRTDPKTGLPQNKTKRSISPGQHNRVRKYTNALQEGSSHEQAMQAMRKDDRGRSKGTPRQRTTGLERANNRPKGRRSKYESVAPSSREFNVGVSAKGVDSVNALSSKFPDMSDREVIRTQQFQRQYIGDELQKNTKWAHETRRANILGNKSGTKQSPDRVVFFTTNLGGPAPSVPSDSLVGQYIIRKRKSILQREGLASARDLSGEFPEAVRDLHMVEASTGISFGAEGRWGAFQKSGWRTPKNKSRNFGKPVPLGQQVLYDSQGRPTYDQSGNIVYTEGATRPFRFETMKDAGLRIFLG